MEDLEEAWCHSILDKPDLQEMDWKGGKIRGKGTNSEAITTVEGSDSKDLH